MKIRIKLDDRELTATMIDSQAARDFLYRDFGYSTGLVILGKIDGGVEALSVSGPLNVTIEQID